MSTASGRHRSIAEFVTHQGEGEVAKFDYFTELLNCNRFAFELSDGLIEPRDLSSEQLGLRREAVIGWAAAARCIDRDGILAPPASSQKIGNLYYRDSVTGACDTTYDHILSRRIKPYQPTLADALGIPITSEPFIGTVEGHNIPFGAKQAAILRALAGYPDSCRMQDIKADPAVFEVILGSVKRAAGDDATRVAWEIKRANELCRLATGHDAVVRFYGPHLQKFYALHPNMNVGTLYTPTGVERFATTEVAAILDNAELQELESLDKLVLMLYARSGVPITNPYIYKHPLIKNHFVGCKNNLVMSELVNRSRERLTNAIVGVAESCSDVFEASTNNNRLNQYRLHSSITERLRFYTLTIAGSPMVSFGLDGVVKTEPVEIRDRAEPFPFTWLDYVMKNYFNKSVEPLSVSYLTEVESARLLTQRYGFGSEHEWAPLEIKQMRDRVRLWFTEMFHWMFEEVEPGQFLNLDEVHRRYGVWFERTNSEELVRKWALRAVRPL